MLCEAAVDLVGTAAALRTGRFHQVNSLQLRLRTIACLFSSVPAHDSLALLRCCCFVSWSVPDGARVASVRHRW